MRFAMISAIAVAAACCAGCLKTGTGKAGVRPTAWQCASNDAAAAMQSGAAAIAANEIAARAVQNATVALNEAHRRVVEVARNDLRKEEEAAQAAAVLDRAGRDLAAAMKLARSVTVHAARARREAAAARAAAEKAAAAGPREVTAIASRISRMAATASREAARASKAAEILKEHWLSITREKGPAAPDAK